MCVLIGGFIIAGCSSSGPGGDAPFTPAGKEMIFTGFVDAKASTLILSKNAGTGDLSPMVELLKQGGVTVGGSKAQQSLIKAIRPQTLANGISNGVERQFKKYGARSAEQSSISAQYLVSSLLKRCELIQSPNAVRVKLNVITTITMKPDGDEIWSTEHSGDVEILPVVNGSRNGLATMKEKAALFTSGKDKIEEAVMQACAVIGEKIAKELRIPSDMQRSPLGQ